MLSMQDKLRISLSLVLIAVFTASLDELRIAIGTLFSWALGHVLIHRLALPIGYRQALNTYVLLSFCLLGVMNDPFYQNAFGRLLDLFFERDRFDPSVPGSGFTDWHETFRRHKAYEIDLVVQFLRAAFFWAFVAISLLVAIPLAHWLYANSNKETELEKAFAYIEKHGERPPWSYKQAEATVVSKRDTRYNRMSSELIFVCGPGSGSETVIDGDIEGAISR
ncbi:hypothetical protein G6011_11540 [Alternaria panax]|uniref:Uncharacterized protein n=1 Tax=Alternaria panax TaxID=48097 RepID=A0AAD4IDL9_9PLEO|nr:hypothetical protein G6011_11540 [Alternaria panax]